jgi:glycosyltransferase involved in cell wall biosynthesis
MSNRIPVIFLTPTFGAVNNGPAIYAKYLWETFLDSDEIEFHLVAPRLPYSHERLHASGEFRNSRKQYEMMQRKSLSVAQAFPCSAIIHGNTAHTMSLLQKYDGPTIAQVNDYDAANIFQHPVQTVSKYGLRRFLSLAWRHQMEKRATKFVTRIVCNSQFTLSQIKNAYSSLRADQTVVIYKAVELSDFQEFSETAMSFPKPLIGTRRILFVGSNWYRKGLDIAIRALAELGEEFEDVTLIVAGAKRQVADHRIAELPKQLNVEERVQFLGAVDRQQLPLLFRACDLFTLPSRQEALGVAILEALATGMPVVATSVGGIPEILQNSQHSALIPPESPSMLAQKIREILGHPEQIEAAGYESREIALRFSKAKMTMAVCNLYKELAKKFHRGVE